MEGSVPSPRRAWAPRPSALRWGRGARCGKAEVAFRAGPGFGPVERCFENAGAAGVGGRATVFPSGGRGPDSESGIFCKLENVKKIMVCPYGGILRLLEQSLTSKNTAQKSVYTCMFIFCVVFI